MNYEVHTVDRLAAVLIFVTSLTGMITNAFIAIYIRRITVLRNSFGRLLQLQAIGDCIFTSVWAIYFAPTLFFDIEFLQDLRIAGHFGQLCLICYDISIYTHLVISFNRFISLYFPSQYSRIFTDRLTNWIVASIVFISFTFSWFLVSQDCLMGFSIPNWMLDYISKCNMENVFYAEFIRGLVVISAFAAINVLTFARMYLHNRRKVTRPPINKTETATDKETGPFLLGQDILRGADAQESGNAFETVQQSKRRGVEQRFVQQVTIQGFVYVAELVTYFYISTKFPLDKKQSLENQPNRWPNFLLTTYAWILVHTLDGMVTLGFNRQFQTVLSSPFRSRQMESKSRIPSNQSQAVV